MKVDPVAELALDAHGASVHLHDLMHDVEAEAEATIVPCGDGALEPLEHQRHVLFRDAEAVILDDEMGLLPAALDADLDGIADGRT